MCAAAVGVAHRMRHAARDSTQLLSCYLKLSKYRLSGLVAFTAGVGFALRHDAAADNGAGARARYWRQLGATTGGTWLAGACANTLNQMYEVRSDALMGRTRTRPLPSGRMGLAHAAVFAAVTGAAGVGVLLRETNETAASLAMANIALYAMVYTPLKAVSPLNTWVGAVVGAIPPVLGWAAASGGALTGQREQGAWALGAMLFLWQIPHFHALAVVARTDYAAGGLRMLAVSNPVANARWAAVTAAAMVPLGAAFTAADVTSPIFAWENAALSWWMYKGARRLAAAPTSAAAARPLFKASIVHLPAVLCLMVAHKATPNQRLEWLRREEARLEMQRGNREVRIMQPWEIMAPFPFLPVPCGAPAVVYEVGESSKRYEGRNVGQ